MFKVVKLRGFSYADGRFSLHVVRSGAVCCLRPRLLQILPDFTAWTLHEISSYNECYVFNIVFYH